MPAQFGGGGNALSSLSLKAITTGGVVLLQALSWWGGGKRLPRWTNDYPFSIRPGFRHDPFLIRPGLRNDPP